MRRTPIVNEAVRMLGEADGIDDELAVLVAADGLAKLADSDLIRPGVPT